jgi:hypothetical protein
MLRILLTVLTLLTFQTCSFAQSIPNINASKEISFLYINGANNNTVKMEVWYLKGVAKLHPVMKKAFEKNPTTKARILKNGEYKIVDKPVIYFWGDKSERDLSFMEQNLAISKGVSPWLAYQVRWMFATIMHDAIWVQKYHNMKTLLEELNLKVKQEAALNRQVVLFGYSAGSFVSFEYLFHKLRYISSERFIKKSHVPQEYINFVLQNPTKNTCIDAISKADLAVITLDGDIFANENFEQFKKNYKNLDAISQDVCAPEGMVRGVVNYASPLPLFYSDFTDPSYTITVFNKSLFRYLVENDMFWLTINYREDPLGFPNSRNYTPEQIKKSSDIFDFEIKPDNGFIYDTSNVWGKRTFFTAHTAYWATRKTFAKAVAGAYEKGWKYYYAPTENKK